MPSKIYNRSTTLKCLLIIVLVIEIALIWYFFGIPCLIRYVTGVICPGCGMTRAWLSVLRLDFAKAMYYNPTFWMVPFIPVLVIKNGMLLRQEKWNRTILSVSAGFIAGTYLIRLWAYLAGYLSI